MRKLRVLIPLFLAVISAVAAITWFELGNSPSAEAGTTVSKQVVSAQEKLKADNPTIIVPVTKVAAPIHSGDAIARLTIPRLNESWIVVEGVTNASLALGPGHYPYSALPGQKGNFAVAGHRIRGDFWFLDEVEQGDDIIAERNGVSYTYKVTIIETVLPTAIQVVKPQGNKHLLTLTTCTPRWGHNSSSSSHRLIIQAQEI